MQSELLQKIANAYQLGKLVGHARTITGGFQHDLWQFETTQGVYVVKKIRTRVYQGLLTKRYLNYAHATAHQFAQAGIDLVDALAVDGDYVFQHQDEMYLVFPWMAGEVISAEDASLWHAEKIGQLVAQLHAVNLEQDIIEYPEPWSERTIMSESKEWHMDYLQSHALMCTSPVISHRDINPHNVLWQQDRAILLDWENVGIIDRGIELLGVALNWANITTDEPDLEMLVKVLQTYKETVGELPEISEAHIMASSTSWLAWIGYLAELEQGETTTIFQEKLKAELARTYNAITFIVHNRLQLLTIIDAL